MVPLFLLAILGLLKFYLILCKSPKWSSGPGGLPFIGNALQIDPIRQHLNLWKWGKQLGDVFKIQLFGENIVVVNSYEAEREVLITKSTDFTGQPNSYIFELFVDFNMDLIFNDYTNEWNQVKTHIMNGMKVRT